MQLLVLVCSAHRHRNVSLWAARNSHFQKWYGLHVNFAVRAVPLFCKISINLLRNMHFRMLKMIATSGFLTAINCIKFVFGWGSALDPALPDPLAGLRDPTSKRGKEKEREQRREKRGEDPPRRRSIFMNFPTPLVELENNLNWHIMSTKAESLVTKQIADNLVTDISIRENETHP